ncbi:bacillithiol system redox-active protein YtxJ [Halalkalibacter sp. AB-rgal2]|uniref:bacillithiol system redox-active protein YtxJ n=1 Tax=Halalkalibacter sp. AB-rgal2 TaxID=3242695 RepID=UPI00359E02E7
MSEKVRDIQSMDEWKELLASHTPTLVLKHSTTCPISAEAYNQFTAYVNDQKNDEIKYALVKVIEQRPISNQIAEDLNLKHESPQCIFVKDQQVIWSATHWAVTKEAITEQIT